MPPNVAMAPVPFSSAIEPELLVWEKEAVEELAPSSVTTIGAAVFDIVSAPDSVLAPPTASVEEAVTAPVKVLVVSTTSV